MGFCLDKEEELVPREKQTVDGLAFAGRVQ